ncbi:MAG TPA: flagellar basal body rod C-terminal domain-containing protein [Syntrophobacteria bacterium]|nr:flagellar basal body rod C-terminal domain-containing protein [Syntrophobacteria bacterium]
MISGINATISGLQALDKKMESTANNTANLETDEFKATRVTLEETEPSGVKVTIQTLNTPGHQVYEETNDGLTLVEKSNVDLAKEMTDLTVTQRSWEAMTKTIQTQDEMVGTILDIVT